MKEDGLLLFENIPDRIGVLFVGLVIFVKYRIGVREHDACTIFFY
jgi:hypothetical protein